MQYKSCAEAEASGLVVRIGSQSRIDGRWMDVSYPAEWDQAVIAGHSIEVMPIERARARFQTPNVEMTLEHNGQRPPK